MSSPAILPSRKSQIDTALFDDPSDIETSDLFFVHVPRENLPAVRSEGLPLDGLERYRILHRACHAAGEDERVLAISAALGDDHAHPEAILNLDPPRRLEQIHAGGGILLRPGHPGPDVLLIYRRGRWDLPKGKPEPDEQIEQCALREVREEVGIRLLAYIGPAGATMHGYPGRKRYLVKRTTWLFMTTPERSFTPEEREGIERVEWFPWPEATERLGYENLRAHLRTLGVESARAALEHADTEI